MVEPCSGSFPADSSPKGRAFVSAQRRLYARHVPSVSRPLVNVTLMPLTVRPINDVRALYSTIDDVAAGVCCISA